MSAVLSAETSSHPVPAGTATMITEATLTGSKKADFMQSCPPSLDLSGANLALHGGVCSERKACLTYQFGKLESRDA